MASSQAQIVLDFHSSSFYDVANVESQLQELILDLAYDKVVWYGYPNAQITNSGTGQRSTGTGTSSGTGSTILDNSLVSSCLT